MIYDNHITLLPLAKVATYGYKSKRSGPRAIRTDYYACIENILDFNFSLTNAYSGIKVH